MGPGIDALNRLEPSVHFLSYSYTVTGYSAMLVGGGVMFFLGALLLMPLDSSKRNTQSGGIPKGPA